MIDGPWWIEPIVTGVSILVGAGMIVWQQRAGNRAELKLKLFEELRSALQSSSDTVSAAGMYAFMAPSNIETYREIRARGHHAAPPRNRVPEFNALHFKAMNSVVELVSLLETHDIVSEHFELFRRALACANSDVTNAFADVTPLLYRTFPTDLPNDTVPFLPQASDADVAELRKRCERYWQEMNTVSSYIHDIKIETQNVLLRGIFRRRVPPRKPADPSFWVLRTDDRRYMKRLKKYFFDEHPEAAKCRALEKEAAAKAAAKKQS